MSRTALSAMLAVLYALLAWYFDATFTQGLWTWAISCLPLSLHYFSQKKGSNL